MDKPTDMTADWLADAPLTAEQRQIWNQLRGELIAAREKIRDMEAHIRLLERKPPEEDTQTILTRPEFNREVARMLAFDERYGGISSVLYFDFEHLDAVSNRYGRSVANAAVRMIGDTLMEHVRNSDILGRLAVDEFGVLLARCDNQNAWKKGEELAAALYKALDEIHGCKLALEISYGAYTFRANEDVSRGLKEAAQMMTRAKGS